MKSSEFAIRLTEFFTLHLAATRRLSLNTVHSYRDAIALLLRFLRDEKGIPVEKVKLESLDTSTILEWLLFLEHKRSYSPSSRNQRLAVLKSFLRYVAGANPIYISQLQRVLAIPPCRSTRPPVKYLEPDLLAALLAQPDSTTVRGRRDLTLLSFMYDTAARSQEVVDTRVRDIRLDSPAQVSLTGKGGKTRIVPLMASTVNLLRDYLRMMKLDQSGCGAKPLFSGRNDAPLTRSGVRSILLKHARGASSSNAALGSRIGPHTLRHTKAMHMLQAGVGIVYIRDVLGHVDIKTTQIYANADLEMKRRALEKSTATSDPEPRRPSWRDNGDLMNWLTSL